MKYCKLSFICNDVFSGCWVMIKLAYSNLRYFCNFNLIFNLKDIGRALYETGRRLDIFSIMEFLRTLKT